MRSLLRTVPRRHILDRIKAAWFEAFPQELNVAALQDERRSQAKQRRSMMATELTAERLEALESAIPAWKRGGLLVLRFIDNPTFAAPQRNFLNRYLRDRYRENADMQQLLDELEGVGASVEVAKGNLQQRLLYTDSVVVKYGMAAATKIKEKLNEDAASEMRKRDPAFDMTTFEAEVRFIFEQVYHHYLLHDTKYLEKVCAGEALGFFKGLIAEHGTKGGVPKYKEILNVSFPHLVSSFVTDDRTPVFLFSIHFQEIDCLVDRKDPDSILAGDEDRMAAADFLVQVMPHPKPDLEAVGHPWLFVTVRQQNKVKQLI